MSNDIRAALERLVELSEQRAIASAWTDAIAAARATLAELVGEGPSGEEGERLQWYTYDPHEGVELYSSREEAQSAAESIMGFCHVNAHIDGWHEDMEMASWGALTPVEQAQIVARGPTEPGDECEEWARYELRPARWAHPAAPPAPEPGEVGNLAVLLTLGSDCGGGAKLSPQQCRRAATLLKQQAAPAPVVVPVPVAERLPGEGDLDVEGKCWWWTRLEDGRAVWILKPQLLVPALAAVAIPRRTHWLPAHAIPLPQAGEGGT